VIDDVATGKRRLAPIYGGCEKSEKVVGIHAKCHAAKTDDF
jgi:hypothetical protein